VKVLYTGYFDRGNLGDNAMRDGNLKLISDEHPEWVVMSRPLPQFSSGAFSALRRFLAEARANDVVFFNGGTYFHDEFGLRSLRLMATWVVLLLSLRAIHRPVFMIGIGIGRLETKAGRFLCNVILRIPKLVTARDRSSAAVIGRARSGDVPLIPDSAYLLEGPAFSDAKPEVALTIAMAPYFSEYRNDEGAESQMIRNLTEAAGRFIGDGKVQIVVCSTATSSGDVAVCERLHHAFLSAGVDSEVRTLRGGSDAMEALSRSEVVLAWRYHAQLLAGLCVTRIAVVPYEPKCTWLREELGLPAECEIAPDSLALSGGAEAILKVLHQARSVDPAVVHDLRGKARVGLTSVFAALDS